MARGAFPTLPQVPGVSIAEVTPKPPSVRFWRAAAGILALLLVAAGALATWSWLVARGAKRANAVAAEASAPEALRVFWKHFVSGSGKPWVVFSNGAFVGRPETGMRYFDASRDSPEMILDHYTGVGEVLAVHELDGVFASHHSASR